MMQDCCCYGNIASNEWLALCAYHEVENRVLASKGKYGRTLLQPGLMKTKKGKKNND